MTYHIHCNSRTWNHDGGENGIQRAAGHCCAKERDFPKPFGAKEKQIVAEKLVDHFIWIRRKPVDTAWMIQFFFQKLGD